MRFVHISDTHIGPRPDFANYGHGPLANLQMLVRTLNDLTFPVDFVLHTGDVVEDRSEAAYALARRALGELRLPIHYVAGNHDDPEILQRLLLGRAPRGGRMDYDLVVGGVHIAIRDTRAPKGPGGTLTDAQLAELSALCVRDGPEMILCLHHPPLPLDSQWLDHGWTTDKGAHTNMLLDRGSELLRVLAPARDRIRGVFFGHVHRGYQVVQDGIPFSGAPSTFGQLLTWPDQRHPEAAPWEPAGFNLVTVTHERTVVRQHYLKRPAPSGPP